MLKMIIKFDEEKVKNESKYELEEIFDYIEDVIHEENLKVCDNERGIYANNEGGDIDDDIFSFMVVATILAGCEWITYAKEWLWYEDTEEAENLLDTFEIGQ